MISGARVLVLLLLSACGGTDEPAVHPIRFPQAVNELHPRVLVTRGFGEALEEITSGRLKVRLFPGGQLYGARDAVQAAALGDVEMALEPETHFITFDDAFKAVDIPFLFESDEAFRSFLDGAFREQVSRSLGASGLVLLGLWDEGPMVLGSRRKVFRSPEDFRGARIRSSGHDLLARSWNEMGAATIRLPLEEVYTALQQGVADAIYTTLYTFVAGKFHEVAPKAVVWPSRATYVWVANESFWDSLSDEDRATIRRLAEEASVRYHAELAASEADMEKAIRSAKDGELHRLSGPELERFRSESKSLLEGWRAEFRAVLN